MKAFNAPQHLITARDHGLDVPDLYSTERPTPHLACVVTRECDPDPLEDMDPEFAFGTCLDCSDTLGHRRFNDRIDVLSHLNATVYAADALARIASVAIDGNTLRDPGRMKPSEQLDFLNTYARTGQVFRRFAEFDGSSNFANTIRMDAGNGFGGDLWDHVGDIADDLTRQWARLTKLRPAHHWATYGKPAGQPLVRAVFARGPGAVLDQEASEDRLWQEAVRLEATRLHEAPGWQLLEWNTNLPIRATDPATFADPAGLTPLEVESAFHIYARTAGAVDAPTIQQVFDAIRAANQ